MAEKASTTRSSHSYYSAMRNMTELGRNHDSREVFPNANLISTESAVPDWRWVGKVGADQTIQWKQERYFVFSINHRFMLLAEHCTMLCHLRGLVVCLRYKKHLGGWDSLRGGGTATELHNTQENRENRENLDNPR